MILIVDREVCDVHGIRIDMMEHISKKHLLAADGVDVLCRIAQVVLEAHLIGNVCARPESRTNLHYRVVSISVCTCVFEQVQPFVFDRHFVRRDFDADAGGIEGPVNII